MSWAAFGIYRWFYYFIYEVFRDTVGSIVQLEGSDGLMLILPSKTNVRRKNTTALINILSMNIWSNYKPKSKTTPEPGPQHVIPPSLSQYAVKQRIRISRNDNIRTYRTVSKRKRLSARLFRLEAVRPPSERGIDMIGSRNEVYLRWTVLMSWFNDTRGLV